MHVVAFVCACDLFMHTQMSVCAGPNVDFLVPVLVSM